jgi:preprotein translocase subunit SecG
MLFLIGLFTIVMVLDSALLIFLVLIQLPKKDAGAGLAFGGSATDALFGAGSGTVLTKITKYAAGVFFVLAVVLSLMQRHYHGRTTSGFAGALANPTSPMTTPATTPQTPSTQAAPPATTTTNAAKATGTNPLRVLPNTMEDTNLPVPIPVNPAPATSTNK